MTEPRNANKLVLSDGSDPCDPQRRELHSVKYEIRDIAADNARSILEGNTHNRNVRNRVIDKYATDMTNGDWDGENGQSIVISDDGRVVDGQHRLWAIVQSETTQRMLVVTGVAMTSQLNIDAQAKRKFSDTLHLNGESSAMTLAAIVRRVALWKTGIRRSGNFTPSNSQLIATLDEHPELRECAAEAEKLRRRIKVTGSAAGLCYWLFSQIDYDDCAYFFLLLRGEHDGLDRGHPARTLVDTINNQQSGKMRMSEVHMLAFIIKSWNAYRDGKKLGLLRFTPGGASPEAFPEPR